MVMYDTVTEPRMKNVTNKATQLYSGYFSAMILANGIVDISPFRCELSMSE